MIFFVVQVIMNKWLILYDSEKMSVSTQEKWNGTCHIAEIISKIHSSLMTKTHETQAKQDKKSKGRTRFHPRTWEVGVFLVNKSKVNNTWDTEGEKSSHCLTDILQNFVPYIILRKKLSIFIGYL